MGREEIRAPLKMPAWEATQSAEKNNSLDFANCYELKIIIMVLPS